jgi:hypothetical protein
MTDQLTPKEKEILASELSSLKEVAIIPRLLKLYEKGGNKEKEISLYSLHCITGLNAGSRLQDYLLWWKKYCIRINQLKNHEEVSSPDRNRMIWEKRSSSVLLASISIAFKRLFLNNFYFPLVVGIYLLGAFLLFALHTDDSHDFPLYYLSVFFAGLYQAEIHRWVHSSNGKGCFNLLIRMPFLLSKVRLLFCALLAPAINVIQVISLLALPMIVYQDMKKRVLES